MIFNFIFHIFYPVGISTNIPINMIIIPVIMAIIAFNLGPPGALIILVSLGTNNAIIPSMVISDPIIMKIVFASIIKIFILV